MTRAEADRILDLALKSRDEVRRGDVDDTAWLELIDVVYAMVQPTWEVAG